MKQTTHSDTPLTGTHLSLILTSSFLTAIHPESQRGRRLHFGMAMLLLGIFLDDGLTFDLYENAKATALGNKRLVGDYPVSSLTAGNTTVLTVDNREMGSNTASTSIRVGDFIQINNTFSPVQSIHQLSRYCNIRKQHFN